jgi:hypothetical protein
MNNDELLRWYNDNRELMTVNQVEKELQMSRGTLSQAIQGSRNLPKKYIEPLTVLMNSLTAAPPKVATSLEDEPVQISASTSPMLQQTREEEPDIKDTWNGKPLTRKKSVTFEDKNAGNWIQVREGKEKNGRTRDYFNGKVYMKTGAYKPATFATNIEDLK